MGSFRLIENNRQIVQRIQEEGFFPPQTCCLVVPGVQLGAKIRQLGTGPLCVITVSVTIQVSIPIPLLETVGLDLLQETLLALPHLVCMVSAKYPDDLVKRLNRSCLGKRES